MKPPHTIDMVTDEEKRYCQQWLNEYYGPRMAAKRRRKAVMIARQRQEQDYELCDSTNDSRPAD